MSRKQQIADLDLVIATLTAERNSLAGVNSKTVATDTSVKRNVTTVHYNNQCGYGERTAQILAHPDVPAKELATMLGTHPRYVYKVRAANEDFDMDLDFDYED
jgi:hypothetical protein